MLAETEQGYAAFRAQAGVVERGPITPAERRQAAEAQAAADFLAVTGEEPVSGRRCRGRTPADRDRALVAAVTAAQGQLGAEQIFGDTLVAEHGCGFLKLADGRPTPCNAKTDLPRGPIFSVRFSTLRTVPWAGHTRVFWDTAGSAMACNLFERSGRFYYAGLWYCLMFSAELAVGDMENRLINWDPNKNVPAKPKRRKKKPVAEKVESPKRFHLSGR